MNLQELEKTARALVAPGKGILAADESFGTIGKRFEAVGIEANEESRRAYREMLFTTPNIGEYLSGVILFEETLRQEASDGRPLARVLARNGGPSVEGARGSGHHPRDKSGQEHRAPAPLPEREVHPGARRAARQALGVQGGGCALHQVAGCNHHR